MAAAAERGRRCRNVRTERREILIGHTDQGFDIGDLAQRSRELFGEPFRLPSFVRAYGENRPTLMTHICYHPEISAFQMRLPVR
ncbi:hypothetical protein [Streptomyces sp. TSRI0281]|uniref:hypothetical protein n=1 Tax=Streptomyces sp. TSRI0281 TaxID=1718998 RepID=UPI001160FFC8|nr:hypothetical protein [Streptomyces sp. TSRI0281]